MRILLALLLCLPLFGAGKAPPRPLPIPDWAAEKRPPTQEEKDAWKAERMAGECQNCLYMGAPAVYVDGEGTTWYVVHHERIGTLAVQDAALLTEIGRCPVYTDGQHDETFVKSYLSGEVTAGTVRQWRESPAVYDGEKLVTAAVGVIPDGWTAATE